MRPFGLGLVAALALNACGGASRSPAGPARAAAPAPPKASPPPAALTDNADALAPAPGSGEPHGRSEARPTQRGWLGVELSAHDPGQAGVVVEFVVPRSPADEAGVKPGDVLLRLDETPVSSPEDVKRFVAAHPVGTRLGIVLRRGSADRLFAATLAGFPEREDLYRMSFVDRPAPPLELLQTAKGSFTPTLAAQKGRVLLVEFWAPWCVACRALIPHMNQLHAAYEARGLSVLGITGDPVVRAASAAGELGMEFPIASDETGKTMRAYAARAIPAVFVIDRRGTVRDVMVGYDPVRIAKVDALVRALLAER